MKTQNVYLHFLFVILFLTTGSSFAQTNSSGHPSNASVSIAPPSPGQPLAVPNSMNYQAVARNAAGIILANQLVGIRISIEDGSGGSVLYSERHVTTTNQFGLFTLKIGSGTVLSGTYNNIAWSNGNQWMKVDMDPAGGTSYTTMGESELLSVPFANFASSTSAVSGTTNSVAQFTGPNTVGNSSCMYDNGSDRIGIGSNTPSYYPLSLYSSNDPVIGFNNAATTNSGGHGTMLGLLMGNSDFYMWNWENASLVFRTNNTDQMTVTGAGNVGIGTTTPGYKLDLQGGQTNLVNPTAIVPSYTSANLIINSTGPQWARLSMVRTTGMGYGATIFAIDGAGGGIQVATDDNGGFAPIEASAFTVGSDRRMKNSIQTVQKSDYELYLNQIRNVESAKYSYNFEPFRKVPHIGFIAQSLPVEVQSKMGSIGGANAEERIGVNLADLSGLLLVGIKALDEKQTNFESEIASLKAQVEELKTLLQQMKK
jgi:hypothetical protein